MTTDEADRPAEVEPAAATDGPVADPMFSQLRSRRGELKRAMSDLEIAIGAPAPGRLDEWAAGVAEPLARVRAAFDIHVEVNEGPQAYHQTILASAPRLAGRVNRLQREHVIMRHELDELQSALDGVTQADGAGEVRNRATEFIATLVRHRQRGSDLVWEAFSVDVGSGE